MELAEVITTEYTPADVADTAESLVESFGKAPIRCKMDIPSFIVHRLMRPYGEGRRGWSIGGTLHRENRLRNEVLHDETVRTRRLHGRYPAPRRG